MTVKMYLFTLVSRGVSMPGMGGQYAPEYTPSADFEKSGQYPDGTVFIEGLVFFHKKWFLYYGCADSKVGVAIYDPKE